MTKHIKLFESFKGKKTLQEYLIEEFGDKSVKVGVHFSRGKIDVETLLALKKLDCYSENLTSLELDLNGETGEESIAKALEGLEELYCWNNSITSLDGIEKFPNLRVLACYDNELTSLAGIEKLKKLKKLYCNNNYITDLKELKNMSSLEILDCSKNKLKNLDDIKNLNLTYLECLKNPWDGPLPKELVEKYGIEYSKENISKFGHLI